MLDAGYGKEAAVWDAGYGKDPALLRAVDDAGEVFVADVHRSQRVDGESLGPPRL